MANVWTLGRNEGNTVDKALYRTANMVDLNDSSLLHILLRLWQLLTIPLH